MIAHAAAAVAILLSQPAVTTARPCITTAELGDVAVVALPDVIESFGRTCSAHLPEAAYLRSGASTFVTKLRIGSDARRSSAMAAIGRVAPPALRAQIGTEAGFKMLAGVLSGQVAPRLNPKTCGELSRFIESLAPLPTENVATMLSSAAGFFMAMRAPQPGAAAGQGRQGPPICPA